MYVCVAGKNQIAIDVLDRVVGMVGIDRVCAVPNKIDEGRTTWQPSFLREAKSRGVRIATLDQVYPIVDLVFLSVEFDRIISPIKFASARLFNIHFSLLPKYRGVLTAIWPVLNGEDESGVTLHRIDHGIDTGDVIEQRSFAISPEMTSRDVYMRCLSEGASVFRNNLDSIFAGRESAVAQPIAHATYYGRESIDFSKLEVPRRTTAFQLACFVRAFAFPEFQLGKFDSRPVLRAEILSARSQQKSGTIIEDSPASVVIAMLDHHVRLHIDPNQSLLDCAREHDLAGVRQWIALGASPTSRGGRGWSALHVACYNGAAEVAAFLLETGSDVNAGNFRGTTPLMYAKGSVGRPARERIVRMLLAAGANPSLTDEDGRTVLDYAASENDTEFLAWLQPGLTS
jgi:methionyl-tRNA formyltransferase